jgi:hypothetical protein
MMVMMMVLSLFKSKMAKSSKEKSQSKLCLLMINQKVPQKLTSETQITLLSTEKKILLMARKQVAGQILLDGQMMEPMMIQFYSN